MGAIITEGEHNLLDWKYFDPQACLQGKTEWLTKGNWDIDPGQWKTEDWWINIPAGFSLHVNPGKSVHLDQGHGVIGVNASYLTTEVTVPSDYSNGFSAYYEVVTKGDVEVIDLDSKSPPTKMYKLQGPEAILELGLRLSLLKVVNQPDPKVIEI